MPVAGYALRRYADSGLSLDITRDLTDYELQRLRVDGLRVATLTQADRELIASAVG